MSLSCPSAARQTFFLQRPAGSFFADTLVLSAQFLVKIIQNHYVLELTIGLKYMVHLVAFHRFPIISQTEITDDFQAFDCRLLIVKQKSSAFQYSHLVGNAYGLLGVCYHRYIKNKFRPDTHCKEAWRKLLVQR